jgi:uncharacterized membrane protein
MRYLLLGSLTLNLVFAGAAGALAVQRSSTPPALQPVVGMKGGGVAQRFDRIVASLPPSDARIMRTEFHSEAVRLAVAEAQIRLSKEAVRDSLRAQPFNPAAVRNAMAETSAARDSFYQLVNTVVTSATTKMSPAGRETLADWPRHDKSVIAQ